MKRFGVGFDSPEITTWTLETFIGRSLCVVKASRLHFFFSSIWYLGSMYTSFNAKQQNNVERELFFTRQRIREIDSFSLLLLVIGYREGGMGCSYFVSYILALLCGELPLEQIWDTHLRLIDVRATNDCTLDLDFSHYGETWHQRDEFLFIWQINKHWLRITSRRIWDIRSKRQYNDKNEGLTNVVLICRRTLAYTVWR